MRKLKVPMFSKGLVLDVGSGANPHPFADVLLEKYLDNTHRFKAAKIDRPTVLGDASKMPFKDNAFQHSLAYHVLEHLHEPGQFLDELQRISVGGYIETPNALYERIHPFDVHLLEVFNLNDTLYIHKKSGPVGDDFIGEMDLLSQDSDWSKFFYSNPKMFHTQYYWNKEISYRILNDSADTSWFDDPSTATSHHMPAGSSGNSPRAGLISLLKKLNRKRFDLDSILACPECKSDVKRENDIYTCTGCGLKYSAVPIPDFNNPV
ncbi:methyltransferase domain-containing protein [Alterisphingorhabdus coralli]|uniref:Methyltransferase domain-containing protein n=1 Tax=Alterisphingorhabdus coralli TaxID=3071408 RepID=A0AA97F5W1_9SPHN|nr:methyltransferase domain-containing protein [Parasphingorhabdus sp. SCSIO 66989]WOE74801.1 methyltransferase domain-containing protein [Parasphingorhabdus sp. SCSIO 66989]